MFPVLQSIYAWLCCWGYRPLDPLPVTRYNLARVLDEAGVLRREKHGRRNSYVIDTSAHLRHPLEEHCTVGELLQTILSPARVRRLEKDHANYNARMSS